ncbi:MAG TPA: hypothetical protein VGI75_12640 [Pirellulales bacterium]
MNRLVQTLGILAVAAISLACAETRLLAADQHDQKAAAAQSVDMFAGIDSGDLQVKFIPKNDREATIVVKNTTDQPLSVKIPDTFVGVPVLAQAAGAGVGAGGGRTSTRSSSQNQNQTSGGGGGGGGGLGGGGFNIPPEATERVKIPIVCLEHGKKDPNPQVPYEIKPLDTFTSDANVRQLLTMLGTGKLDQQAAQAAAWHFTNGMSWDELANKKIHHTIGNRPDEPYFTPDQIRLAMQIASQAGLMAKEHPVLAADKKTVKDAKKPVDRYSSDSQTDDSAPKLPTIK